jgi:hypothetical protein
VFWAGYTIGLIVKLMPQPLPCLMQVHNATCTALIAGSGLYALDTQLLAELKPTLIITQVWLSQGVCLLQNYLASSGWSVCLWPNCLLLHCALKAGSKLRPTCSSISELSPLQPYPAPPPSCVQLTCLHTPQDLCAVCAVDIKIVEAAIQELNPKPQVSGLQRVASLWVWRVQ